MLSTQQLTVNKDRLYATLQELGQIGGYLADEHTGLQGVNRLALTPSDGQGRRRVVSWMKELGLAVTVDRIGNVYGRRAGRQDSLDPVMIGSHIDSVPTAGRFDGCLGVMGGLEIVRRLNELGLTTKRPVVLAFFTDEEGCRFGTDMLGSAVATGRITLEDAYALTDRDGLTVRDELEKIGFLGEADERVRPPHAYLECHIEQGPVLRAKGMDVGVVEGVQAISWQAVSIEGKSCHAGTTPMNLRVDAGVAAAKLNLHLRKMIASGRYGEHMRTTMGGITPVPGLVNIVPGRCDVTVDLRNPSDELMQAFEQDLLAYYERLQQEDKVKIVWRQTARTDSVTFDAGIKDSLAAAAEAAGLKFERITSGAGHDAQEFSHICRTAMVFVPGEDDGISHNPRELSTAEQCANGVNVLFAVLMGLVEE